MRKYRGYIRYKVQPQRDGTYVVLQKYLGNKKVEIHSHHDTYEEAQDELASLESKPTQSKAMKMINDLRFSMDSIK